ncbi:MAG: hypothetical protein KME30_06685 [Iphinoe sp. HA4291-MV1]|jgi:hypothetical protein|nr:hypothetical protein [Iphinoe sp. HA4291-MV1]
MEIFESNLIKASEGSLTAAIQKSEGLSIWLLDLSKEMVLPSPVSQTAITTKLKLLG